jgi:hypothetical protein
MMIANKRFYRIVLSIAFTGITLICLVIATFIILGIEIPEDVTPILLERVIEINIFIIVFLLLFFIITMVCKFSGSPYKSQELFKKVRHIFVVYSIWTLAFILKVVIARLGTDHL